MKVLGEQEALRRIARSCKSVACAMCQGHGMSGRGSCREGENQPKGEKGVIIDSKAGEAESSKL